MLKDTFYFTLKSLFVLKIEFYLDFSVMQKNGLITKARLISKLITSQPEKQTIVMHILSNISKKKGNKTMKKQTQNMVEKQFPDPFLKKSKLSISLNQYSKVLYNLFLLYAKLRAIEIY